MNYTTEVKRVLDFASALLYREEKPSTRELLVALATVKYTYAYEILRRFGFTESVAKSYTYFCDECMENTAVVEKVFNYAHQISSKSGYSCYDTQHILLGMLKETNSVAYQILRRHNITYQEILPITNGIDYHKLSYVKLDTSKELSLNAVSEVSKTTYKGMEKSYLEYGNDFSKKAFLGEEIPLIGRKKELQRLSRVLGRKNKFCTIIIGEEGVGRSFLVEKYALSIIDTTSVLSLNVQSLIAGTKYRGDLEEKLQKLLSLIIDKNIIIYIKNLTCDNANSDSVINLVEQFSSYIEDGLRVIISTTSKDYTILKRKCATIKYFTQLEIEQLTDKETIEVLCGLKLKYEEHYGVDITADSIEKCVYLSKKYMINRFLPEKAIDLLDETCSMTKEKGLKRIGSTELYEALSELIGVPLEELTENKIVSLINIESLLNDMVIGQKQAMTVISNALIRKYAGVRTKNTPIGSFLFVGRTGVGKTQTAKALAKLLFGSEKAMIRLDMSEYAEKGSVSKLIGTSAGYIGYEEDGILTAQVRKKPYNVLLLDEIEKSDNSVRNMFLQILDEGFLTDSKGVKVDFSNTIIIMTSNANVEKIGDNNIGFTETQVKPDRKSINNSLKNKFSDEFLNRIDSIIYYNKLSKDNLVAIANIYIREISSQLLLERNINLVVKEDIIKEFVNTSYDKNFGARPILRSIDENIINKLSYDIVANNYKNLCIYVDKIDDEIIITTKEDSKNAY